MKRGGHEDGMICSVGAYIAYRIGTYTCMPYVYNSSQDVEKCTQDLVLSYCTRTNAIQDIALASKECPKFLLHPLPGRPMEHGRPNPETVSVKSGHNKVPTL